MKKNTKNAKVANPRIIKNSIITIEGIEFRSNIQIFNEEDDKYIQDIYSSWRDLSEKTSTLGGRGINLPDILSEAFFCRTMNSVRVVKVNGTSGSFDAYCMGSKKRIQVKACSVLPDLTSFGPKSVWDELYFLDFYNEGKWDGSVNFYLIPNELIYNHKQNKNKNQTFREQQAQGKRPRMSLINLIKENNIEPIKQFNIFNI
jgi:hypothetical protein